MLGTQEISPASFAELFVFGPRADWNGTPATMVASMVGKKQIKTDAPAELAQRLTEGLQRERIVPRFVDSYVVEHGRHALQVHASLYRDLLELLQREALLAATARALEITYAEPLPAGRAKPRPMLRKDGVAFRRKFLAALTRQQKWSAGEALDFQTDLQMYEDLLTRNSSARRSRKPFEAANHPFVDRCAFLLDSSFLEKARVAASRALTDLENLTAQLTGSVLHAPETTPPRVER
jgi:hypothetical protein